MRSGYRLHEKASFVVKRQDADIPFQSRDGLTKQAWIME
jgi:hypothetical protein